MEVMRSSAETGAREGRRTLTSREIETLETSGCRAEEWARITVADPFDATLISNVSFRGEVRLSTLEAGSYNSDGLELPVGISESLLVSCTIGANPAIHRVTYLGDTVLGDRVVLLNLGEAAGHGADRREGREESAPPGGRRRAAVMNESGSREIALFDEMLPADAYLWARYRDDQRLLRRLEEMTVDLDPTEGCRLADDTVVRQTGVLRSVRTGPGCRIVGADRLEDLFLDSSLEEPTLVGSGVELVAGVCGPGCRIDSGARARRFLLGGRVTLELGARLVDSVVGDNSTVACGEVRHSLLFPAHEQHHNSSFLVATLIGGQSNIAAGATIGSNHNSRAPDGELQAGRGFWPGLSTSFKHSSRFASFVLLSKGDYPAELDIPFPFALVSRSADGSGLEILPAFWWLYNMYALARNDWKFAHRDRRLHPRQHIEFSALAPDTVEEIIRARALLEEWTGRCEAAAQIASVEEMRRRGAEILRSGAPLAGSVEMEGVEKSRRPAVVLKPRQAYQAYREMLVHYAGIHLTSRGSLERPGESQEPWRVAPLERVTAWENLGGQIVPAAEVDRLRGEIGSGVITGWSEVHHRYDELHRRYGEQKRLHAVAVYQLLSPEGSRSEEGWREFLREFAEVQRLRRRRVVDSRQKDYANPFRRATYRREEEMVAALGTVEEDGFIRQVERETSELEARVAALLGGRS
ncbi:MAG: DUF4954 family protein [Alkalispirochaetaceae bacterium]